jgi:ribosome-associated protein
MDERLDIGAGLSLPLDRVEIRTSRSSGPGGQHANVTASRVEAVVDLAGVPDLSDSQRARLLSKLGPRPSAISQDTRSQMRNREIALNRLAAKLAAALVEPPPRRPSRPTRGSVERRLSSKRRQSARKQDRRPPPDA